MKDLVEESISILNSGKDITGFGELLHEAWQAKRSLSTIVSNSHVDEIYEYAIGLQPIANVFKAGHCIQLEIESMMSPRDPDQFLHYHPRLCSSKTTLHKIYRGNNHRSHLLLSVVPREE